MIESKIIKTICQYSKPLPQETIIFLQGIAKDYSKVKKYVYNRYSGVNNIDKLTPGFNVLNEMRNCGLRQQLQLPVVYYELAILDALTDIKIMWIDVKKKVRELVNVNPNLSDNDRSYIRLVLKIDSTFSAILQYREYEIPNKAEKFDVDTKRLNNLIRRLVRRYKTIPKTSNDYMFKVSPNGYSYKNGGIKLVSRVDRHRVFIPLKDDTPFNRQITVTIESDCAVFAVPITMDKVIHEDYINTIFVHIGYADMCTLSNGNIYGAGLGELVTPETERLKKKNENRYKMYLELRKSQENGQIKKYKNISRNNLGKLKYDAQKRRIRSETENFINHELNIMIEKEKPIRIVITSPIKKSQTGMLTKKIGVLFSRSFNGYIRERLKYKCRINGIELVEINSKGTGSVCSKCGDVGKRKGINFICEACGLKISTALNSAKNIEKKYQEISIETQE